MVITEIMRVVNKHFLHQTDYENPKELKHLIAEKRFLPYLIAVPAKQYITTLSQHEQENIKFTPSNNVYCFGNGRKIKAIQNVLFFVIISK